MIYLKHDWINNKYIPIDVGGNKIWYNPVGEEFIISNEFYNKGLDYHVESDNISYGYFENILFTFLRLEGNEGEKIVCRLEAILR